MFKDVEHLYIPLYYAVDRKSSIRMVENITDNTFGEFIGSNRVAVVDCWAAWCYPCRFLSPVIDELAKENGDVAFGKLNVDENRAIPMKYGIMSIPTLLYFKDGRLVDRSVGALPKKAIQKRIQKIIAE
jgi:thioredoxin 1